MNQGMLKNRFLGDVAASSFRPSGAKSIEKIGPSFYFAVATLCVMVFSQAGYADVHDRWIWSGKVKSEYDQGKGSGSDWLTLWYVNNGLDGDYGCLFDVGKSGDFGCPGRWANSSSVWGGTTQVRTACGGDTTPIGDSWLGCLTYDTSSEFKLNNPSDSYWVVNANNDPAFDQCRAGPPGLSEPISDHSTEPESLYNVKTADYFTFGGGWRKELKVKINASEHQWSCDGNFNLTIPFISIGSHTGWGNPNYVATLNNSTDDRLRFSLRVSEYTGFTCNDTGCPTDGAATGAHVGFFVIAEWSGKPNNRDTLVYPRFAWVDLVRTGVIDTWPSTLSAYWSWPIFDSMFWPGGEIALVDQAVAHQCSAVSTPALPLSGAWVDYDVNLTNLFSCLSAQGLFQDQFPSGTVNVTGVHFFAEVGNATAGNLEFTLRNIRID